MLLHARKMRCGRLLGLWCAAGVISSRKGSRGGGAAHAARHHCCRTTHKKTLPHLAQW